MSGLTAIVVFLYYQHLWCDDNDWYMQFFSLERMCIVLFTQSFKVCSKLFVDTTLRGLKLSNRWIRMSDYAFFCVLGSELF